MLKRREYIDIIEEIRNTELLALDEFIEKVLEPLRAENKYFDEILYKDITYLLDGFGQPGDNDLVIEDGDWVIDRNDLKLTGYQTRLHNIQVWLHTNIVTKLLENGDVQVFLKGMESFETDHLCRSEYTPEYKAMLDKLKSSLQVERHQNQTQNHMSSDTIHSTNHDLTFFTNPNNIRNQRLVKETIEYFTDGPGTRAFELLPFMNLLKAQREFVASNRINTQLVLDHLGALRFSDLQKHVLLGFILKWNGGYPVDNLDPDADRTLKAICKEFLAYPEATPEKEFCKTNAETHKRFRYLESLFNTSFRTGIPVDVLAKQTEFQSEEPFKRFSEFNDLYLAAVEQDIVSKSKDHQSLAVQMVKTNNEFNSWLEVTYQWHPADREGYGEFLTIEYFREFINATKGNVASHSIIQAPTDMEDQNEPVLSVKEDSPLLVFVTYAWEDDEHNERVISFTNHLRGLGYNAVVDRLLSQQESATHFKEMMYRTLTRADKVIIVLSKKYKTRADNFEGGVGTEFRYIISDLPKYPKKYILVALEGYSDIIIPNALQDREIIDLSREGGWINYSESLMMFQTISFAKWFL
ncbi:toll/interleukin-1 receptor domain-containing protein [Chitinophaga pollutisoli]|uniref:Toll/interleukin-1 receptor domain-containing protein n=1 Tax=Chitinophaga pollutisoli TaxID=3133966 RepID=A0ABZ2YQE3_9BACT